LVGERLQRLLTKEGRGMHGAHESGAAIAIVAVRGGRTCKAQARRRNPSIGLYGISMFQRVVRSITRPRVDALLCWPGFCDATRYVEPPRYRARGI